MKIKFSEWIRDRMRGATRTGWLAVMLCAALKLAAAVWIQPHWETVTGTGWIPVWVEAHYVSQHVDGYWETQTIGGHWEDVWIAGHTENVWVDGHWAESWTDGSWQETWIDGYWADQWNDGHWADIWVDGYEDGDGNWHDGYSDSSWVDGSWSSNWVDGHSEWSWVDGSWSSNWVDGYWTQQTVDGYWDQNWVPPSNQQVWVEAYDANVLVEGAWTLQWGNWSVDIWVAGHWQGEWTWIAHENLSDWNWSAWSPDASTVLAGTTFTQTRFGVRSRVTWETNEAGEVRNFVSGPDYSTDTQQATGTKPITWTPFNEPGAWYHTAWTPDPATVPCGQAFTQSRTPQRDHRAGERNELGAERNVTTTTESGTPESRQATGTQGCGGTQVPSITSATSAAGTVGSGFSYRVTATNSPTGYAASGLPIGLTFNTATGMLSGTPTTTGTFTVSVTATNAAGTGSASVSLTITPQIAAVMISGTSVTMVAGETYASGATFDASPAATPAQRDQVRRGLTQYSFRWLSAPPRYYSTYFEDYFVRNADGSIATNPDGSQKVTGVAPTIWWTVAPTKPGTYVFEVDMWGPTVPNHTASTYTITVTEFPLTGQASLTLPGNTAPQSLRVEPLHWAVRNPAATYPDGDFFDLNPKPVWDSGNAGSPQITVLVLDTGVQAGNPALPNVIRANFASDVETNPVGLPYPQYLYHANPNSLEYLSGPLNSTYSDQLRMLNESHGTKVAGAIAGLYLNSTSAVDKTAVGIAPGVRIASARIGTAVPNSLSGLNVSSLSVIDAINWGVQQGARISNTSIGTAFLAGSIDAAFTDARSSEYRKSLYTSPYAGAAAGAGMLHFAATGNEGANNLINSHPANLPSVMAVGAVTSVGQRASFSNYGAGISFIAPGAAVVTGQPTWLQSSVGGTVPSAGFTQTTQLTLRPVPSVTVAGTKYTSGDLGNALPLPVNAPLVYGGLGTSTDPAWNGKIVMLDRGTNLFHEKERNVAQSGGVGCIIANNQPGIFSGNLVDASGNPVPTTIPVVTISQEVGTSVKNMLVSQPGAPASINRILDWGSGANNGTSFASPYAAGVAALILSQNPSWTATMVEARMQATAKRMQGWPSGYDTQYGWGMPNAREALRPGFLNMLNLSTRGQVTSGAEGSLAMGFVVRGSAGLTKRMLIRAVGPKLADFGVAGVLTNPNLSIVNGLTGVTVASNTRWNAAANATEIRTASAGVGAFALPENGADCAILCDLPPGEYTAVINGLSGAIGTVLAEVYDASGADPINVQIGNLSTRASVVGAQDSIIGGFVVEGNSPRSVLIRAVGPSLPGVTQRLANPRIRLLKLNASNGWDEIAGNDDWNLQHDTGRLVRGFGSAVGAFPLTEGSRDAALHIGLSRGLYTIEVSSVDGTSGVALVEVYPAVD